TIDALTAGQDHILALATDGTVYGAGDNLYGQLGLGDEAYRHNFTAIVNPPWGEDTPVAVTAGDFHSIVLTASGKAYVAGSNYGGKLGLGDNDANYTTFTKITAFSDKSFTAAGAGRN